MYIYDWFGSQGLIGFCLVFILAYDFILDTFLNNWMFA